MESQSELTKKIERHMAEANRKRTATAAGEMTKQMATQAKLMGEASRKFVETLKNSGSASAQSLLDMQKLIEMQKKLSEVPKDEPREAEKERFAELVATLVLAALRPELDEIRERLDAIEVGVRLVVGE